MLDKNLTNTNEGNSYNKSKITYEQFGREHAQNANGNPGQLGGSLNIIYNEIIRDAKLDENERAQRKLRLIEERRIAEKQKIDKDVEIENLENDILSKQKEIEQIEQGKGEPDIIPFVISAGITLLLSFFLWTFYAAAGYAAYNGVKDGLTGFKAVVGSLDDLSLASGFVKAIVILFPAIFIGLGFLIHDSIERKRPLVLFFLIIFTFCFDSIIGYIITRDIYMSDPNQQAPWEFSMIFSSLDFYLILASGFVSYIMWGYLLNTTLNRYNEMKPSVKQQQLSKAINENRKNIITISGERSQIIVRINSLNQEINNLERNVIFISISELKAKMGYFMSGWGQYVNMMKSNEAERLIKEANLFAETWFDDKVSKLRNDNTGEIVLNNN